MSDSAHTCNLCGAAEWADLYGTLHATTGCRFRRCRACGLIQMTPSRSAADEAAFYAERYHDLAHKRHEPASRGSVFASVLEGLERAAHVRRLLDVGCGPGDFVAAAACRGWDAEGLEISPAAVRLGRERHPGIRLHTGELEHWQPERPDYGAVTFLNVLDQLVDPAVALRRARALLAPGGVVLVRVPNGAFHHALRAACWRFPVLIRRWRLYDLFSLHLFSFTARTLGAMLERSGFEDIRAANSPLSRGDPAGALAGWRLRALSAAKSAAGGAAAAVQAISWGRWHIAPSIVVSGRRGEPERGL